MTHVVRQPGIVSGTSMAVFLALVHAVNDVLTGILGALLPTLQVRFAASTITLALFVAAFAVSSSVTQPILGALADRAGLRRIAGLGVALAAVSLSLVGVAGSVAMLLALLVLGGVGSAALHPVSTSIVGGTSSRNPSLAVGLFTAGGMAGLAGGPILILYLISSYGTEVTPWLMLPGLVLAVGVLTLLPVWEPHGTGRLTQLVDRRVFGGPIWTLTAAAILVSLAFIAFSSAVPLWLVAEHGLATDAPLLGWALGIFFLAAAIGAIAGGAVGERLSYARVAFVALLSAAPVMIGVLLLPPGALTLAAAAVAGALLYASQPLFIVAAQNAVPQSPAAAAGVVMGVGNGVAGLLYVGVGALQDIIGLAPAIALTFILLLPAAFLARAALRPVDEPAAAATPAAPAASPHATMKTSPVYPLDADEAHIK